MKKVSAIIAGIAVFSIVQAQAQLVIPLVNYDFEEPGTGKISSDWGLIPGWSSDSAPADSGVETGWTTSGDYNGYLANFDPAVWQTSGYTIASGDVFSVSFLSRNNWSSGAQGDLQVTLYYDDGGTKTPFGSSFAVTEESIATTTEFMFEFAAPGAAAGSLLGVEFNNMTVAEGGSWLLVDRVMLVNTVVPEPTTFALLGMGALALISARRRRA